ncbi:MULTISPECIES: hypothetical protein [unclassified Streptomyces]|uniref:hypothetical protein n=1 Tax=unclassified Streptomyces TaxID=2593676 RepID=UPI0035DF5E57
MLPDTSKFGTDLQRYLDRIEARAKVNVKVIPDTRKFAADLRTDLARINAELKVGVRPDLRNFKAQLRAMLDTLRVTKKVEVEPDTSQFSAKLTTRLAAIRERVKVAAEPDLSGFRERLRAHLDRIRAELKVKIRPDLTGFRTEVNAIIRGLRLRPIKVLIRPTLDMRAYARVRARLRALGRPITVRVRTTGSRIPNRTGGDGGNSAAAGGIARAGAGLGGVMSKLASLPMLLASIAPQVSSLVASLMQTGPALGVAATGLLAAVSAGAALAIGLKGIGDALGGDAEALAQLAPSARDFVGALKAMGPAWSKLRLDVQERLFKGLGDALTATAKTALPVLRTQLGKSADALNAMGKGILTTTRSLSTSGALGTALDGANKGLANLAKLPAVIVQGLVQVGAAAAPAFDRLTKRAGGALDRLSASMTKALENGSMEKAIERSIDVVKQFVNVGKNVGSILGNVFGAASKAGNSFLDTLEKVTGSLAKLTAAPEIQSALFQLFKTLATVSSTVVGILGDALRALAPAVEVLGPPLQRLVRIVGSSLKPVFAALQPVLKEAAKAAGELVDAVAPFLPVIGRLAAKLLPSVTPLLTMLKDVFAELEPIATHLSDTLEKNLTPIFEKLPGIVTPLAQLISDQLVYWLQFLDDVLVEIGPSLVDLGASCADLLVQLGPVIVAFAALSRELLEKLRPVLPYVVSAIGLLAKAIGWVLSSQVTNVAIPALQILAALLRGDFIGAANRAKEAVKAAVLTIARSFQDMAGRVGAILWSLAGVIGQAALDAGGRFVRGLRAKLDEAISYVRDIPNRARAAVGNLGGVLISAGVSLISGFISGIRSKIDAVRSTLSNLTDMLPDWKGPKKRDAKILTPAGRSLIEGFIKGIDESTAKLKSRLESITKALPSNVKSGYGKTLKKATNELEKLVKKRDGVIKKLAAAEKKLADLTKARNDVKKGVVDGILSDADLTKMMDGSASIQGLTQKLKDYAAQAKKFAADIEKLKKRGLDADIIRQIADAGVTNGGATAALLASASAAQIKELNKAQADLEKAAGKAGNTAADALYQAGIQSAKGLVKGLESQQDAIEKQMIKIAKSMQKAIKKALGIHSPARKMIPVGRNTTLGVLKGVEDKRPALDRVMASLVAVPSVSASGVSADVASSLSGGGLDGARLALVLADGTQLDAYVDTRVSGGINEVRRRQRAGRKW